MVERERASIKDAQYTVGRLIETKDKSSRWSDALPYYQY